MQISYYVAGNTAKGRMNVLHSNIEQCEKVIVLSHPSVEIQSQIIRSFVDDWLSSNQPLEIIASVEGKPFLDGVIHPEKNIAIVSNTVSNDSINITHTIDLSSYILETDSRHQKVVEHQSRKNKYIEKATEAFATGLRIHDELEHMYIEHMDFTKADAVAEHWLHQYLSQKQRREEKGQIKTRLFGTTTAEGAVNSVPEIIQHFPRVHHVKGRAGTGKSYFMNTIKEEAIAAGYDIEQYMCSFDPSSTDMIVIREHDLCIFDSTDPHAFLPSEEDVVIDLYEQTVDVDVDEQYKKEIEQITANYKGYVQQAITELNKAKVEQDVIDQLYRGAWTNDVMHAIKDTIQQIVHK